jgi:imidazolonepropionase-like amidohydrolase
VLALRAARVHTGTGGPGPGLLLVEDGVIVGIGPDRPMPTVAVTDLGDVTVLPGLVDTHVHLAFDASGDIAGPLLRESDEELLRDMADRARTALAAGITTVRDLGDRRFLSLDLRDRLRADPAAGPRLLVPGPPLTRRGGHCWFLGGDADTVEELRLAVRRRAELSCDAVKVVVTGGVLTPGFPPHESQYDLERLQAVVREAHAVGLPVAAHVHGPDGIRDSVEAGVDSVEHCTWFTADGVAVDREVVRRMAATGTVLGATLGQLVGRPVPPVIAERQETYYRTVLDCMEAGVPVVCGTDGGIGPAKPHDVLPRAVIELVDRGVPFATALATATSAAAAACGLGGRAGRIAVQHDPDLLVVRGDPEADVRALLDVAAVYRRGVLVHAS